MIMRLWMCEQYCESISPCWSFINTTFVFTVIGIQYYEYDLYEYIVDRNLIYLQTHTHKQIAFRSCEIAQRRQMCGN